MSLLASEPLPYIPVRKRRRVSPPQSGVLDLLRLKCKAARLPPAPEFSPTLRLALPLAQSLLFALGNACCRRDIHPRPSSLHRPSLHFLTLTGGWPTSEDASLPSPPEWGRPYLWAEWALGTGWLLMASVFWKQTHTINPHVPLLPETYTNSPPQSHFPTWDSWRTWLCLPIHPLPSDFCCHPGQPQCPPEGPATPEPSTHFLNYRSLPPLHHPCLQPNLSYHVIQGHLHNLHLLNLLHLQPCLLPSVWTPRSTTFPSTPPVFSLCTHCVHSVPRTPIG